jgi:predicted DNA-binding transcriptional regulator AlpA
MHAPNEKEYLSQIEAAQLLGLHQNTLVALSKKKEGPPRSKITARLVRYKKSDLVAWMDRLKEAA